MFEDPRSGLNHFFEDPLSDGGDPGADHEGGDGCAVPEGVFSDAGDRGGDHDGGEGGAVAVSYTHLTLPPTPYV